MASPESPLTNIEIRHFIRDLSNDTFTIATLAIELMNRDLAARDVRIQRVSKYPRSEEGIEELGRLLSQIPEVDEE